MVMMPYLPFSMKARLVADRCNNSTLAVVKKLPMCITYTIHQGRLVIMTAVVVVVVSQADDLVVMVKVASMNIIMSINVVIVITL